MSVRPWHDRSALVSGGTGFIGRALARRLAELGASVIIPTRDRSRIGKTRGRISYIALSEMAQCLSGVGAVFNLAYDFRRTARENIALYGSIADACAAARVPMLVQASSIAVYDGWPIADVTEDSPCDGPGHAYKAAKRAIEQDIARRVAASAFDAVILQPTIVYGPGSPQWTDALVERMQGGTLVLPENLAGQCNGVYIDDVVEAFVTAAGLERGGAERFILSGPEPFPWGRLLTAYAQASGAAIRYEETPPYVPSTPVPPSKAKELISAAVRRVSALAAGLIGTSRLERLRSAIMRRKPGPRIYRPVTENPRLFHGRGVASVEKMREAFYIPVIGPEEGLARTQAYIRAKYTSGGRSAVGFD